MPVKMKKRYSVPGINSSTRTAVSSAKAISRNFLIDLSKIQLRLLENGNTSPKLVDFGFNHNLLALDKDSRLDLVLDWKICRRQGQGSQHQPGFFWSRFY